MDGLPHTTIEQKKTFWRRSLKENMVPKKNTKETKASKTSQNWRIHLEVVDRISYQKDTASGHTPASGKFFVFKVDGQAPLREVQCPPTDRLSHP